MTQVPVLATDPINTKILTVSEDQITGFHRHPFDAIARQCGCDCTTVMTRLLSMKRAGVIRRVRQTLLATKLAYGALVAWKIPPSKIEAAFDWLLHQDPFTGHVVLRETKHGTPGEEYKLWTTLKVPVGCNTLEGHCSLLKDVIGADDFVLLPAKGIFSLGVGHMRRRLLKPGDKKDVPPTMESTTRVELSPREWAVLLELKEELTDDEFIPDPWQKRAERLGMSVEEFCDVAKGLDRKRVIGRFATFLEHVKTKAEDGPITRFNGLFHWAVPEGMEAQAGAECGRHICMTHCYWRTGGAPFGGAQIMGVVHGLDQETVLAHKAAIDAHLQSCGIPILHTAVFWSTRSEIKPSEISPVVYDKWLAQTQSLLKHQHC